MVLPATLTVGTRGLLGALRQLRGVSGSAVARGSAASPIAGGTSSGGDGGGGNAGSGGAEPDVFTASLQHKAEEELQQLIAKPGQGATPVAAAAGDKQAGGEAPPQPAGGLPPEYGGYAGPEPTRYKDWEIKGRCSDF
ncbi:hypothetical protein CHLNCDRAFT_134518 [Chlorella variabilis]|uniref:Uncharacterized protein n=1 Tax=Chlorella variabilis TaxID=554065 RepID=E1ZG51_CHLVA|nr:hypothetical protein CHLNCDRAFT_134518 [Chlorella variabilis]EFN55403.1 hypothetical protein CHLNCDRAFT_134518 [Chlorella variabilis]|eukprot:XP_005847505.1 hypothetical protein CHLNCDRAFT_134518 [Chlorella variabilis]